MPDPNEKPNIYPPSIIDPLNPGGIQSSPDGSEAPAPVSEFEKKLSNLSRAAAGMFEPIDTGGKTMDEIIDEVLGPLAPDPEGVARDRYLGELAREWEHSEGQPIPKDATIALDKAYMEASYVMCAPEGRYTPEMVEKATRYCEKVERAKGTRP
jgi:hypothetical protein